jgi:hypothetical protein
MEHIDQYYFKLPVEAMLVMADALKVIARRTTDTTATVQEVLGDLESIRDATRQVEAYYQSDPTRFRRRPINQQLLALTRMETPCHESHGSSDYDHR